MCYCSTNAGAWALNDESESGVIQGLMTVEVLDAKRLTA